MPKTPSTFSIAVVAVTSTVRPAEARGVVELVAVEAGGARQEGADEAADQERAEDVSERELDALAAQQHQPAVHRGEDADELDARGRQHEGPEGARVDQADLRRDQSPGRDVRGALGNLPRQVQRVELRRVDLHLVIEQQPEGAHRHPGLQHVQDATAPRIGRHARNREREQRRRRGFRAGSSSGHLGRRKSNGRRRPSPEVGTREARQVTGRSRLWQLATGARGRPPGPPATHPQGSGAVSTGSRPR